MVTLIQISKMTTKIESQLKSATDLLVQSIINAKSKWMDSVMAQVLPNFVYAWSRSGNDWNRRKLSRWLARNSFEIKEGDGFTHIMVGDVLVSEWRYRVENGKVEQIVRTAPANELQCLREIYSK